MSDLKMNTNGDLKAVPEDRAFESPEALTASEHNEHASIDPSVSLIDGGESVLSSRRRAKNKDFQDIEETGKWGDVSMSEVICVVVAVTAVVVTTVVLLMLYVFDSETEVECEPPVLVAPTLAPTSAPLPRDQLDQVIQALRSEKVLSNLQELIPDNMEELREQTSNSTQHPVIKAASWITFEDDVDAIETLVPRFALAYLYYATTGEQWSNNKNWLSDKSVCEWFGVECELGKVKEIDLSENNLQGDIPPALSLLKDVNSLWFKRNRLSGPIPGKVFTAMKNLKILYLQKNELTGPVPFSLIMNGNLHTLFVQENGLTGEWPFCPTDFYDFEPLLFFGLDCDRTPCPVAGCCNERDNCF